MLNDLNEPASPTNMEEATQRQPATREPCVKLAAPRWATTPSPDARIRLTANPYYATGWIYLFRLMQLTSAPEGSRWLDRARQHHPRNFNLALLGARLLPDDKIPVYISGLLAELGASLTIHEKPAAGAAFAQALGQLAGLTPASPKVLEVLKLACVVFPLSAKLTDLHARQLLRLGQNAEASREFARASELRLTAKAYQAEYPKEDGSVYWWQFGEQIMDTRYLAQHLFADRPNGSCG